MADVQSIMYVHVPTAWNADLCLRLLLRRVVELAAPDAVDAADGLLGGDPLGDLEPEARGRGCVRSRVFSGCDFALRAVVP